jgi:transaldolase
VEELEISPGAPAALAALKQAGFRLYVVTNQPDVARGTETRAAVERIHAALGEALPLDGFYVCYHDDRDRCECRKPKPGLLLAAAAEHGIALGASYMIGDRWRDVEAGQRAGCRTAWLDLGYAERGPAAPPDATVASLAEAAAWILREAHNRFIEMRSTTDLRIRLFADGADKAGMLEMYRNPAIRGFTTNPTLMRKAGVRDYEAFAREVLAAIPDRPISFEVLADEIPEMEQQARAIARWGENVYVKIPVTNTRGESSAALVRRLSHDGIKVNVTALLTLDQVRTMTESLAGGAPSNVSVFAGRIADTGRDPVPVMAAAVETLRAAPSAELIWASPRELLNVFQADAVGCHIITATHDILKKLPLVGKDLSQYSLETVEMFCSDARASGFTVAGPAGRPQR